MPNAFCPIAWCPVARRSHSHATWIEWRLLTRHPPATQELDLSRNPDIPSPVSLSCATSLERLALSINVAARSVKQLASLQHLQVLVLDAVNIISLDIRAHEMRALLETVASLPCLEQLDATIVPHAAFAGALGALVTLTQRRLHLQVWLPPE